MLKGTRQFLGMVVALVLMITTTPFILIHKSIQKSFHKEDSLTEYYYQLAVSTSQYYASFLYETEDWTTSSLSYYKRNRETKAYILRVFIDLLLGKNHCKNSYEKEREEIKKQGEQL